MLAGGEDPFLDEIRAALIARDVAVERVTVAAATAAALPDVVVCDPNAPGVDALIERIAREAAQRVVLVLVAEGEFKLPDTTRGRAAVLARSFGAQTIASRVELLAGTLQKSAPVDAAPRPRNQRDMRTLPGIGRPASAAPAPADAPVPTSRWSRPPPRSVRPGE